MASHWHPIRFTRAGRGSASARLQGTGGSHGVFHKAFISGLDAAPANPSKRPASASWRAARWNPPQATRASAPPTLMRRTPMSARSCCVNPSGRQADAFGHTFGVRCKAGLEIGVDRHVGCFHQCLQMGQHRGARQRVVRAPERPGMAGAGGRQRLEAELLQIKRAADVPGIGQQETTGFVQGLEGLSPLLDRRPHASLPMTAVGSPGNPAAVPIRRHPCFPAPVPSAPRNRLPCA